MNKPGGPMEEGAEIRETKDATEPTPIAAHNTPAENKMTCCIMKATALAMSDV